MKILNKKIVAILTVALFLLSTFAVLAPVQAHFTLGQNQPNYPYTVNNFDNHVNGIIGYVFPGGGENSYLGTPTSVSATIGPGYIAPYPLNALTGAGVYPSPWTQNLAQVDGHEYSPFGAIVVGSTGDLIFAINATSAYHTAATPARGFTNWYILLPPEFKVPGVEQIVTTITNNGASISKNTLSPFDRYAPGWTLIAITADKQTSIHFNAGQDEWYYVRINGATAPTVAGKYFFKMAMYNSTRGSRYNYWVPTQNWPVLLVKGELDPAIITGTIRYGGYNSTLYGTPIGEAGMVKAVMKTKLDPYTNQQITGGPLTNAVAYFNGTYAAGTLGAAGHYELEGVAPGIYDLYAQAAGYPQALIASNVQVLKGQSLHFDGYLNPGPVIHGDIFSKHSFGSEPWPTNSYVKVELYDKPTVNHVPSSNATLVSWSPLPCVAGGQPNPYILNAYPSNMLSYYPGNDAGLYGATPGYTTLEGCLDPRQAQSIAFPWHEWTGSGIAANGAAGVFTGNVAGTDPQGIGPGQTWFVTAGSDTFHFEYGAKGMFGAPRDLDGHVPQVWATWVNGLTAGRYYARAWVFRYVQSALDGATFQEYSFQVTPNEWAGDISLPIDLRISSWINKTVHFHNNAGTLSTNSINTGARYLTGGLYDANNVLWSYNVTTIGAAANILDRNGDNEFCNTVGRPEFGSCNIQFWGFNDTWIGQNYGIPAGTYTPKVYALGYIQQTFDKVSLTLSGTPIQISNHLYRGVGFNFTVYSIDWERPRVNRRWVWPGNDIAIGIFSEPGHKYVGAAADSVGGSRSLTGAAVQNSTYWVEFNGRGRNVQPNDNAHEVYFGDEVGYGTTLYAKVGGRLSSTGRLFSTSSAKTVWTTTWYFPTAFDSGQYSFQGWTYGYIQNKEYIVYANKGQVADMKINLIIGVNVTLDILFKKENLITRTETNMSARVRLFDDSGRLVATWMSSEGVCVTGDRRAMAADGTRACPFNSVLNYVPGGIDLLHVNLAGFPMSPKLLGGIYGYGTYGAGTTYGDPVFTPASGNFKASQWPFGYWTNANPFFPNAGILGQPDYTGTGWTAEVDFVNLYLNDTVVDKDPFTNAVKANGYFANFYPIVPGLLMGESFHIIPGTAAASKISWTEDGATNKTYVSKWNLAHSMAPNHLGPYSQQGVWTLTNAPLSGETSAIWEVDLNGYVSGTALAFTWSNEFRSISWYTVSVLGANNATFNSYVNDGLYEFYLVPGQYSMSIIGPGYKATPLGTISVTSGQSSTPGNGNNVQLPQSNIPVPEFSGIAVVAFSALAASLYLLRRKRQ